VVEVDHVVLHVLRAEHQVADELGVGRHGDPERVLHRADRGEGVDGRADAAGAFGERPGVARVTPLQDDLEAPDHRPGAERVDDFPVLDLRLDAEMAFDPGDRVDYDAVRHHAPPFLSLPATSVLVFSSLMVFRFLMFVETAWAAIPTAVPTPTATPTLSAVVSMPKPGNDARCW
jgi:hypothetical protein